jgi:hypothetical protein
MNHLIGVEETKGYTSKICNGVKYKLFAAVQQFSTAYTLNDRLVIFATFSNRDTSMSALPASGLGIYRIIAHQNSRDE